MIKIALQQKNKRGLTPTRRQFIIWTNDGLFAGAYMRHSASMSKRICFNLWNKYLWECFVLIVYFPISAKLCFI